MKTVSSRGSSKAAIWRRAVEFETKLSPTAARALLKIRFSPREHERMNELLKKARSDTLTPQEEEEVDTYERLGCLIGILHSKARQALKKPAPHA
jgi:hypothetical protein